MYWASVRAPAIKICYGYSFLNVHAVQVRETRIMGVWCARVMCLSHHVMKHMVHLCVYKQVSHLRQVAFPLRLKTGCWCASADHVRGRSPADPKMQKRGARRPCDAWWDAALPTLRLYCIYCVTQPCACCTLCGAYGLCVLWARALRRALVHYL